MTSDKDKYTRVAGSSLWSQGCGEDLLFSQGSLKNKTVDVGERRGHGKLCR